MNEIKEYVEDLCGFLNIPAPEIIRTDDFPTPTMLAEISSDGKTLRLRKSATGYDMYFAVTHELRHGWQIHYHYEQYFSDYKRRTECATLEEYNLQPAEIDSNAFGVIIMADVFHVRPTLSMPPSVAEAIEKRIAEIVRDAKNPLD